ncbi:MAG: hypothetical protein R6V57_13240 [Vicinamibacterales bacterium]
MLKAIGSSTLWPIQSTKPAASVSTVPYVTAWSRWFMCGRRYLRAIMPVKDGQRPDGQRRGGDIRKQAAQRVLAASVASVRLRLIKSLGQQGAHRSRVRERPVMPREFQRFGGIGKVHRTINITPGSTTGMPASCAEPGWKLGVNPENHATSLASLLVGQRGAG